MSNLLEITQLSKFFGDKNSRRCVLSNINLRIQPGEFVCLLGPSGCGKSTLLNAIAGFNRPECGIITVNDKPVSKPGPDRGFVFQKNSLLPWMTLDQNVGYGLKIQGLSKEQINIKVEHFLDLVGLIGYKKNFPHELSGGMQQRGSIVRALITNPKVLLMDEPFGAVDAQTRIILQEMLLSIWAKVGITIIFVTHDIDEAVLLADRIVVMGVNPGHIKEIFDVSLKRPRSADSTFLDEFRDIKLRILRTIREETDKLMIAA
ncbi:ABC-type transport system/ ATPase component [Synechococcus sp. BIOS-E4-1]|uniref:ABC transporter ATP-binding protein n=1 Tax=Synechococcus sp. BIOS-E4-1 TaxID=1400864 RepID=UPI001648ADAB|nr:ABC transporter ATP-binding protein [Synechococcus sp. BIOS-E4-1]QNI52753.1 ABC-type transport system/ ATPase component [Synechococcus sp. BIOS-E4-1]